jgi:Domain of unknown function (DUF4145)
VPQDLQRIFAQAVTCAENDCYGASLVMARVFADGLLTKAGFEGNLDRQIKSAREKGVIGDDYAFHLASASRLMGNSGGALLAGLLQAYLDECKLVLGLVRALAADILASGMNLSS